MYKKINSAALCGLSLVMAALSHAGEAIDQREIRMNFSGNTVEGKVISLDTSFKMYFHPSGKLVRLDAENNAEKGTWNINDKNELCLTFTAEQCNTVNKRGDNMYDLYGVDGKLGLTFDKVKLGNPDKLKP